MNKNTYQDCPVVKLAGIRKHENADSLSIVEVDGGFPVVIRTVDFKDGDLAIYVPIDSLIREGVDWVKIHCSHLTYKSGFHRVKAARLRGVFSMGMLIPVAALASVNHASDSIGDSVGEELDILKFEELEEFVPEQSNTGRIPRWIPKFLKRIIAKFFFRTKRVKRGFPIYGVEHYLKNRNAIKDGEEVVVTEKLHGSNVVFCYRKRKLVVSSHKVVRGAEDNSTFWKVARQYDLATKLKNFPDLAFFGEVFGPGVQDMTYGVPQNQLSLRFFDVFDCKADKYLAYDDACQVLDNANLPKVPRLYRGPFSRETVEAMKDGPSTVDGAKHFREGVVIRKVDPNAQRTVLKLVGEQYLLRKGGTEKH